jgi:hypothetical protein
LVRNERAAILRVSGGKRQCMNPEMWLELTHITWL